MIAARLLVALAATFGLCAAVQADSALTYSYENDIFAGTDRYYTHGHSLKYYGRVQRDHGLPGRIAGALPGFPGSGTGRGSIAIGQKLFTADDITDPDPPPDDRPYAGWLYLETTWVVEQGYRQSTAGLTVGAIGPRAGGDRTQSQVHAWLSGSDEPEGWGTQLEGELGATLRYQDRYRGRLESRRSGWGVDVIPGWALWAGNVYTAFEAELILRVGRNLPYDHGGPVYHTATAPENFYASGRTGWHFHLRAVQRVVGQNLFLDGNTIRDSRSTEREKYVGQLYAGLTYHWDRFRVSYTHTALTREFEAQEGSHAYGVLAATWVF